MEKSTFAISVLLVENNTSGGRVTTSHVLSVREATSEDEAVGSAVKCALEAKPGFAIADTLCLPVFKGEGGQNG